jgi:hypothetical protein
MSPTPGADSQPTAAAPIACSLEANGLRTQEQRWTAIVRDAGIDRTATAYGITLTFRADTQVERELRNLVAIENECCAWARWEVRTDDDGWLAMQASATRDGVATLQAMFPPGS